MRYALIHFLDRIKDYEHESGHSMHEDERESSEIVDIHLEAVPELKNYVFISNVSTRFGVFSKVDDVFEQLSVCSYDKKEDAQSFADAMRNTVKYFDTEIVVLNVC